MARLNYPPVYTLCIDFIFIIFGLVNIVYIFNKTDYHALKSTYPIMFICMMVYTFAYFLPFVGYILDHNCFPCLSIIYKIEYVITYTAWVCGLILMATYNLKEFRNNHYTISNLVITNSVMWIVLFPYAIMLNVQNSNKISIKKTTISFDGDYIESVSPDLHQELKFNSEDDYIV